MNFIQKLCKDRDEIIEKQHKETDPYMKHYYEGKKAYIGELLVFLGYEGENL